MTTDPQTPTLALRTVPAVVTAGDSRAAKAIHGESKVFLEVGGLSLVARAVLVLQDVPEVDAVWVVGDRARLEAVLAAPDVKARIRKPLHVIEQLDSLLANLVREKIEGEVAHTLGEKTNCFQGPGNASNQELNAGEDAMLGGRGFHFEPHSHPLAHTNEIRRLLRDDGANRALALARIERHFESMRRGKRRRLSTPEGIAVLGLVPLVNPDSKVVLYRHTARYRDGDGSTRGIDRKRLGLEKNLVQIVQPKLSMSGIQTAGPLNFQCRVRGVSHPFQTLQMDRPGKVESQ